MRTQSGCCQGASGKPISDEVRTQRGASATGARGAAAQRPTDPFRQWSLDSYLNRSRNAPALAALTPRLWDVRYYVRHCPCLASLEHRHPRPYGAAVSLPSVTCCVNNWRGLTIQFTAYTTWTLQSSSFRYLTVTSFGSVEQLAIGNASLRLRRWRHWKAILVFGVNSKDGVVSVENWSLIKVFLLVTTF